MSIKAIIVDDVELARERIKILIGPIFRLSEQTHPADFTILT